MGHAPRGLQVDELYLPSTTYINFTFDKFI